MYSLLKFKLVRKAFRLTFLVYKCISYLKLFNVTVSCFPIELDAQRRLISYLVFLIHIVNCSPGFSLLFIAHVFCALKGKTFSCYLQCSHSKSYLFCHLINIFCRLTSEL